MTQINKKQMEINKAIEDFKNDQGLQGHMYSPRVADFIAGYKSCLSNLQDKPNPNKAHIKDGFLNWHDKDLGETVLIPLDDLP